MDGYLTQIGVAGILAILVIREVFGFLKNNRYNEKTDCISRNDFERLKNGVQYKDNCQEIVKRFDLSFKNVEKRFDKIDEQFDEVKTMIKNNR